MDKDFIITGLIMILSSMQSVPPEAAPSESDPQGVGIVSNHAMEHVNPRYIKEQRLHDQQGCGGFVLYG